MADYVELWRRVAAEIVRQDGRLGESAAAFVAQVVNALRASGWRIDDDAERIVADYLGQQRAAMRESIARALVVASDARLDLTSREVARMTEEAFNRRWPDGLTLSRRLWNWNRETRKGLTEVLRQAIAQGKSANDTIYSMQRRIERAASGEKFRIVERYREDWVTELWESAQTVIHNPKAQKQWQKTMQDVRAHIDQLQESGTRSAAQRVFSQMRQAVNKGNGDLASEAVNWWIYDKQLFHLKRIARTEMATASHRAVIDGTLENPAIIGYQWRLSGTHPHADICDYYANIEMGLGRGVWTKEAVPRSKAHPHCMCLLIPRVTRIQFAGSNNYADFLRNATPERRAQLLPKWAQQWTDFGIPLEKILREDGLGLITRENVKDRIKEKEFDALNVLATAKANKDWGSRKFKTGNMTRRTLAAFAPFKQIAEVRSLLDDIDAGKPIDGLRLKYLTRKYPEGERIQSPQQIDAWFDAVLSDLGATIRERVDKKSRYAVHSEQHGLLAIIDPDGQRISVYSHDGNSLNPIWLTLNQLIEMIH